MIAAAPFAYGDGVASAAPELRACRDCATRQWVDPAAPKVECIACGAELAHPQGRSIRAALALSAATLLLLIPGNLKPFLSTTVLGVSRHSHLVSAADVMARDGEPLLAAFIFLFAVLFPLLRFGTLTLVLGSLEAGHKAHWQGALFRLATMLQTWSMPDVFLLGLAIAYARLSDTVATHLGPGALCFIAAGVLSLFVRAMLDTNAVWRAIGPGRETPPADDDILCYSCDYEAPRECEHQHCPRCGATLKRRLVESVSRTVALTLAAALLYIPANLYPLATLPIQGKPTQYTVIEGVFDLVSAKLWGLAAIVFVASFLIPMLKVASLAWCVSSVLRRSDRHLAAKTRAYRVVEEIGRWSMVDPFVIGCFVPVMAYNALIYGRAGPAAVPFALVVVLTIISAKTFDPRLMWDVARRGS